LNVKLACLK